MVAGVLKALAFAALGLALALVSGLTTTDQVKNQAAQVWKTIR
jgi:hypothetical protein